MTDWIQFADGLARELARLPAGVIVIIADADEHGGDGHYVQFVQSEDGLRAELVGDFHLESAAQPSAQARQLVLDAGWQIPDRKHGDNWWIDLPWPVSTAVYRALAAMVVTGLRDGLGVSNPDLLLYRAWNDRRGNRPLDLPLLCLRQERV